MNRPEISIFWFRRDLRLDDNAALWKALKSGFPVLPIFIFDEDILNKLEDKKDARVLFIHQQVSLLKKELEKSGSSLQIFHGKVKKIFQQIIKEYQVKAVYCNRDYEPYAKARDEEIYNLLKAHNINFIGAKDQVIFEKNEILKSDGKPYTIFTPYSKKWRMLADEFYFKSYPCQKYFDNFWPCTSFPILTLKDIGFEDFKFDFPTQEVNLKIIKDYKEKRDYPAIHGTSRLSLHLRFGTISIRRLCKIAVKYSESWLNELIWRDFYQMIIYHFPHSSHASFKISYDKIKWRNDEKEFKKWCEGKTGYPLVDAGMRELNSTGYMHNRVRMVVASFLCKHLLIDWRWGENYFAKKLLDYDLASNVGGWQWAAGTGCDAAPYFRIFNPESQAKKFDPENIYIKKWIPELETKEYPEPIIDHKIARVRCLQAFISK